MTTALDRSGTGWVAIVAGGSRGAGLATVGRLAASGFAVVVNYLHDQRAAESAVESILADLVADVVAFLLSESGHSVSGRVLRVGDPGLRP